MKKRLFLALFCTLWVHLATAQQTPAFLQAQRHIAFHAVSVAFGNQRAHVGGFQRWVSHAQLFCAFDQTFKI